MGRVAGIYTRLAGPRWSPCALSVEALIELWLVGEGLAGAILLLFPPSPFINHPPKRDLGF